MNTVFYILFICLFLYALLLGWLALGFLRTRFFVGDDFNELPVSIIICARNEEKNIAACLASVLKQDYEAGNIQLILINDASTDKTVQIAETILRSSAINYRIISNPHQKGKKQSITYAITQASHELLVLRDADTFTTSFQWLKTISDFYQATQADLVIAPVALADNTKMLWALQAIENNILVLFACGSSFFKKPFLCSGANLIFTKNIFGRANGYQSHLSQDSGDDIFFMEDVKKIPGSKINYLKSASAIVYTYPSYSFQQLLKQKIRWASKFKVNKNGLNLSLAVLSFVINAAWLFCFAYIFFVNNQGTAALAFIILKLSIDILLLFLASGFIKNKDLLWFSLPAGCIYPVYACIIGLASVFIKPKWKF